LKPDGPVTERAGVKVLKGEGKEEISDPRSGKRSSKKRTSLGTDTAIVLVQSQVQDQIMRRGDQKEEKRLRPSIVKFF